MSQIEIVTHVYSPPGLDTYAQMLRWQFASLVRHRGPVSVTLTVCHTSQDSKTMAQLDRIRDIVSREQPGGLRVQALDYEPGSLFRRAIGRNYAALHTAATVAIWFTDVDYLFGPGALEAVCGAVAPESGLSQPAEILIHRSHALGDEDLFRGRAIELPEFNPAHFERRRQKVAIGGCQIVGATTAKSVGYCRDSKWVQPVDPEAGFRSCRCDRAFRKLNQFAVARLPIPHVYRMRHGRDGRDVDLTGVVRGREVW